MTKSFLKDDDWQFFHGLIYIFVLGVTFSFSQLTTWPLFWLVSLAVYFLICLPFKPLRKTYSKIELGELSKTNLILTSIISILSIVTLISFYFAFQPDMNIYKNALPIEQFGGVILMGIFFPIINAISEELVFRVIIFDSISAQAGKWVAALLTSILFGYIHMKGYPPGIIGAISAGIYGLSLAYLKIKSNGMLLPVCAHIIADITIYCIVIKG